MPLPLLEPNLYSKLIINQYETKLTTFYCYIETNYKHIELWTNLSTDKDWHSVSFIKHTENYYKIAMNIAHLTSNKHYEFTLRYKLSDTDEWEWLGQPGQNGSIYLVDTSLSNKIDPPTFASVPQLKFTYKQQLPQANIWHFKTQSKQVNFSLGSLSHSIHSYTAIIRKG